MPLTTPPPPLIPQTKTTGDIVEKQLKGTPDDSPEHSSGEEDDFKFDTG